MRIYIAGPMRGLPDWNLGRFQEAERRWREAGHIAFNPAHTLSLMGQGPYGPGTPEERVQLNHAIQVDLACLYAADAIALLPGWERSRGATVELALAQFLGLDIYHAETMERIYPEGCPWGKLGDQVPFGEEERVEDADAYTVCLERRITHALDHAQREYGLPGAGDGDHEGYDPDFAAE